MNIKRAILLTALVLPFAIIWLFATTYGFGFGRLGDFELAGSIVAIGVPIAVVWTIYVGVPSAVVAGIVAASWVSLVMLSGRWPVALTNIIAAGCITYAFILSSAANKSR